MVKSIYEYEIKMLGSRTNLEKVADKLIELSKFQNPPKDYLFETEYFDTPEKTFTNAGYSIRYRAKQGSFDAGMEIKQITGGDGAVSKRLEIGVKKNVGITSLYFNLLAHEQFPKDIKDVPAFDKLQKIYSTVVQRREQEAVVLVGDTPYIVELAMDKIDFVKDGLVIAEQEEFEVELKSGLDCSQEFMEWFKTNVVGDTDIQFTLDSKSKRLQNFLDLLHK